MFCKIKTFVVGGGWLHQQTKFAGVKLDKIKEGNVKERAKRR
jgi:hypothetical protein